ncbi:uncharacterized protein LOC120350367 isoform X1 [Nilaparvata lugens]|uniref:uncharacterized protein LOC120350367 isoform X1 n=1 Tax=Nilaparvata lugens TaxID=108931 RepID=UPI00193E4F59|nr:uncharacterized protein LOC120350367 isoform X1 [Nilaparvata lugens]
MCSDCCSTWISRRPGVVAHILHPGLLHTRFGRRRYGMWRRGGRRGLRIRGRSITVWEVFKVNSEPANINQEVLTNDDLTKCRDGQHDLFNTKFPTQDEKKTVLKILGEIINGNVASPGQLTLSEFRKCQLRTKYNNVRQAARRMSVGTSVGKPRGRYAKKHRTNP